MSVYEPSDRSITNWNARIAFLLAIRREAPEVLEDLQGIPLELYRCARSINSRQLDERPDIRCWKVLEGDPRLCGQPILALRAALHNWANKYNLKDKWCLERAFYTIEDLYDGHLFVEYFGWHLGGVSFFVPINDEEARFEFTFKKWDTTYNTRRSYEDEAEKAFKEYLKDYCDRLENLTRERGYVERKGKRNLTHFDWLVHFQVKGESYKEIYNHYRKEFNLETDKAVKKAIHDLANLIGLTLRPEGRKPGRHRKSKAPATQSE